MQLDLGFHIAGRLDQFASLLTINAMEDINWEIASRGTSRSQVTAVYQVIGKSRQWRVDFLSVPRA